MKYKAITRNCKENVYDFYVEKDFLSKKPKMGKIKSLIGFSRHVDIHECVPHTQMGSYHTSPFSLNL